MTQEWIDGVTLGIHLYIQLFEKTQGEYYGRWAKLSHSGQLFLTAKPKVRVDQKQKKKKEKKDEHLVIAEYDIICFKGRSLKVEGFHAFR